MKLLAILILFINVSFASPFVQGGKVAEDNKYNLKLVAPDTFSCSGVQIRYNKILTAAHCVLYIKSNLTVQYRYSTKDSVINKKIISIIANKNFIDSQIKIQRLRNTVNNFTAHKDFSHLLKMRTLNDIAINNYRCSKERPHIS